MRRENGGERREGGERVSKRLEGEETGRGSGRGTERGETRESHTLLPGMQLREKWVFLLELAESPAIKVMLFILVF